jgi:hypothetical protein
MSVCAAVAWYTPESWRQLQAAACDALCSYAEFLQNTEAIVLGFKAQGIAAEKVTVDVAHMAAWCKRHGYPISDTRSRAAYGSILGMHRGELFDINTPIDDASVLPRTQ